MRAEIITIGDEILIGQTIDTNSAWLGKELNNRGIDLIQITSINDKAQSITQALQLAETRADVILITGGLGPTKDDITKQVLANYFNTELVINEAALANIKKIFSKVNRPLLQINIDQALIPASCTPLPNSRGTAPGMLFNRDNKIYVSMPGVPYEMKAMMEKQVFPFLEQKLDLPEDIVHQTITVVDVPESVLSTQIEDIEDHLPSHIKLAYLPHLNLVRLRLTAKSIDRSHKEIEDDLSLQFNLIKERIGNVWFDGDRNLSEIIGKKLKQNHKTIGTIESCSGGFIAHRITSVPGSSSYYYGSLLTYDYKAKTKLADIPKDLLYAKGAVSYEVAELMAKNAQNKLGVDYCISTTGIAGPGGGTDEKPVGLVYIGLALPNGQVEVKKCNFHGTRDQVIERTAYTAFNMVRLALEKELQSVSLE
jgi:nicotinamide-nucleotide amidase